MSDDQPTIAECPSSAAVRLVGSKWALDIVFALRGGPLRNGALLRRLPGVSQKVLSETLRSLAAHGLVERTEHPTVPPQVEYGLTPAGRSLSDALTGLDAWALARERLADVPSG
jgi:DNA-binding HxlR family transcriptional regulator